MATALIGVGALSATLGAGCGGAAGSRAALGDAGPAQDAATSAFAPTDGPSCLGDTGDVSAAYKACETTSDCTRVSVNRCCATARVYGIARGADCSVGEPACPAECVNFLGETADDGMSANASADIGVVCTGGRCETFVLSADAGADAGSGAVQCGIGGPSSFPTFDKACQSDADCALVHHQTDCCGGQVILSVRNSAVAAFQAAEATCDAQYPGCGCFDRSVLVEDGAALENAGTPSVTAKCESGACRAEDSAPTFACGDQACDANSDICYVLMVSTDASPMIRYTCSFAGSSAASCATANIATGCQCSTSQGHVVATCPAP